MNDPSEALQRAIVVALKAASTVAGVRVYDRVPVDAVFPYISVGEIQVAPDRADCIDGADSFPVVHVWSRAIGYPEVKQIGAAIIAALDDVDLTVTGNRVVSFLLESIRYMRDPDGLTSHGVITFHAITEAT